MSVPLTVQGITFQYPTQGDNNWGPTLTNWSTAVTNAIVPLLTGGSIQVGPHPGATVNFANATNTGYLPLAINGSNQLTFNGNVVNTLSLPVSVPNGGTGDSLLTAYSVLCGGITSTGAIQSVSGVGLSGQALVSNGAGMLPTWQNVSGSGTVNSGTAGNLAYYATSSNQVSDSGIAINGPVFTGLLQSTSLRLTQSTNQLSFTGNGGGNQIRTISITPTTTVGEVITIPDSGGSDTVALLNANNTFTGTVNVPNAATTTEAMAFGQGQYVFQNAVQGTSTSSATITSGSFTVMPLSATITPTSSSSRIKITISGTVYSANAEVQIAILQGGTRGVPSPTGYFFQSSADNSTHPINITYIDSPASTSSLTYAVSGRFNSGTGTPVWNPGTSTATIILEELR